MSDRLLVLVGPEACRLATAGVDADVVRVRTESIRPVEQDIASLVREAPKGIFAGADADRWRLLSRARQLTDSDMIWACTQVQSANLDQASSEDVLVLARTNEDAVLEVVRALMGNEVSPVVALFGGRRDDTHQGRRNHTVLTDLLRDGRLRGLMFVAEPADALQLLVDELAWQSPVAVAPRMKAVDIGTPLELPPTWAIPRPGMPMTMLQHVPFGQADGLATLVAELAARRVLQDIVSGPPVDVEGLLVAEPEVLLDKLQDEMTVADEARRRVEDALSAVEFSGEQSLSDQIIERLDPVRRWLEGVLDICAQLDRARLAQWRAFGAAGIDYTCQRLRTRLDDVQGAPERQEPVDPIPVLLGTSDYGGLAWRSTFAGLPSYLVDPTAPGASMARKLIRDRFAQFRNQLGMLVAGLVEERVRRAREIDAPLPIDVVRPLYLRAARVRDTLRTAYSGGGAELRSKVAELARNDALLRWIADDPAELQLLIEQQMRLLPVSAELERMATVEMTRRPLGMADDDDFEVFLRETLTAAATMATRVTPKPTYSEIIMALVRGRDPRRFIEHLKRDGALQPTLRLRPNTDAELLGWLQGTGANIEVYDGQPCVTYWDEAAAFTSPESETYRGAATEHRAADLLLPPPEGDTPAGLAALARGVALLQLGLAFGEIREQRLEGVQGSRVSGPGVGIPEGTLLPYGGIHLLANDPDVRSRLRARLAQRLDRLADEHDALDLAQRLQQLAHQPLSQEDSARLGLNHPRLKHLLPAAELLIRKAADIALVALIDRCSSDRLAELIGGEASA